MISTVTLKRSLGARSDMEKPVEAERGQHLLRALQGTDITVFYQGCDLKYQWIENPPIGWVLADIIGQDDFQILPLEAAEITSQAKRDVIESRKNRSLELEVKLDDGSRWFDIWIDPDFDDEGKPKGVLCFSIEITDRKRKEESLRELLLEVSHRSRNLLAIVQSIANQSLRTGDNEYALARFNERIQSLAITLDIVTDGDWDGATLADLVTKQTSPYLTEQNRLKLAGLNPQLTPNAAVHIGLALQELISNSARASRAMIDPTNIAVNASRSSRQGSEDSFVFEWREKTSYRSISDESLEMDSLTLRQVVPAALNGSALVSHSDGELVYSLTVPVENFS